MGTHGGPPADDERPINPKDRKPSNPTPDSPPQPGGGDHRKDNK